MASGWQQKQFGECAVLIRETVSPAGLPSANYVGLEHIGEGSLVLIGHGVAGAVTSAKSRFRRGDILFGKLRPYFRKVVRAPFDGVCSTDIWVVRPRSGIDPGYLFYWMASEGFVAAATQGSDGTKMPRAKWEFVSKSTALIPPIPEQRAIARILGALDDKIELNRRMNETLEAMARALFKSWFIDFDPVHAKAEGRDPGLPTDIAALFPDSFEDSELGKIPKGWEVKTIGDLVDVVGGGTPSTKEPAYWNGGSHLWATPKDLAALSVPVLVDTARHITDTGLLQISSGLLPIGTVLLSSRAPIGYLAIAESPTAINQGFIAMLSKKTVSNVFVLLWARAAHDDIVSRANGSTFLEINKANFRPIPVVAPTPNIMAALDRQARRLYDRIVVNVSASATLATVRDALLSRLLSGELRVKGVDRSMEAQA